ncbi:hypothetical protein F5879DRAFT_347215 [Lentinula edodes]|nr:hypothetical protein F5879DRAFT_347215 [Lentinula edodes]
MVIKLFPPYSLTSPFHWQTMGSDVIVVVVNILPFEHFSFYLLYTFHTSLILYSIQIHPSCPLYISSSFPLISFRPFPRPNNLPEPLLKGKKRSEILNLLLSIFFFAYFFLSFLLNLLLTCYQRYLVIKIVPCYLVISLQPTPFFQSCPFL